jgi:hypothetical protein
VLNRPDLTSEQRTTKWPSKAAARTEVKRLAREYAKKMGVKMVIQRKG